MNFNRYTNNFRKRFKKTPYFPDIPLIEFHNHNV